MQIIRTFGCLDEVAKAPLLRISENIAINNIWRIRCNGRLFILISGHLEWGNGQVCPIFYDMPSSGNVLSYGDVIKARGAWLVLLCD